MGCSLQPRVGILGLLDDECLRPGSASDLTLLEKINRTHKQHKHFESRASKSLLSDHSLGQDAFRLVHYAGRVRVLGGGGGKVANVVKWLFVSR